MTAIITGFIILAGLWLAFIVFIMPILAVILGLNIEKADKHLENRRKTKNAKKQ